MKRSKQEIDKVIGRCGEAQVEGTHYHGMSYEEGVEAAIAWLLGSDVVGIEEPEGWPFDESDD